jgi:hypothetical protein
MSSSPPSFECFVYCVYRCLIDGWIADPQRSLWLGCPAVAVAAPPATAAPICPVHPPPSYACTFTVMGVYLGGACVHWVLFILHPCDPDHCAAVVPPPLRRSHPRSLTRSSALLAPCVRAVRVCPLSPSPGTLCVPCIIRIHRCSSVSGVVAVAALRAICWAELFGRRCPVRSLQVACCCPFCCLSLCVDPLWCPSSCSSPLCAGVCAVCDCLARARCCCRRCRPAVPVCQRRSLRSLAPLSL